MVGVIRAANDGVTYFFLKTDDLFSHRPVMTFLAVVSSTLPPSDVVQSRLFSVLSKFSHKKVILVGCHPLDGVTRGGPPPR